MIRSSRLSAFAGAALVLAFTSIAFVAPAAALAEAVAAPAAGVDPLDAAPTPTAHRPAAGAAADPRSLFGSVPIRVSSAHDEKWRRLLQERADSWLLGECPPQAVRICSVTRFRKLASLVSRVRGVPEETIAAAVNAAVNTLIAYAPDLTTYGMPDHWATFSESMERGQGDCEDLALVKYWAMRAAGVSAENMQFLLARYRGRDHAVLVVRVNDRNLILDNINSELVTDDEATGLRPLVSLSESGTWIHAWREAT